MGAFRLIAFAWVMCGVLAASAQGGQPRSDEKVPSVPGSSEITIVLVGDSTTAPEGGWGPGFCADLVPQVRCIDTALNGRSTKSFREEGAWDKALALKGNYYLIQFGHNDQKEKSPKVYSDPHQFALNLKRMIAEVRAINAVPVLITPLSRRTFVDGKVREDLKEYADVTRQVAAEENVACIDLNALSTRFLNSIGQEKADEFDAVNHADQRAEQGAAPLDRTHLNEKGKVVFGRMVADELKRVQVELGPDILSAPVPQHASEGK